MELFKIERFGVDYDETWKTEQEKSFQLKIEKRKRNISKKDTERTNNSVQKVQGTVNEHNDVFGNEKQRKKIKKKKKKEQLEDEDVACRKDESPSVKKKKKKENENSEKLNANNISEDEAQKKLIKKKKEKKSLLNNSVETEHLEHSNLDSYNTGEKEQVNDIIIGDNGITNECLIKETIAETEDSETANMDLNEETEEKNIFPILEKHKHHKKEIVRRDLPKWLNEPHQIPLLFNENILDINECVSFLGKNSLENLKRIDIRHLFPVQAVIVPHVLKMYRKFNPCLPQRSVCVQSPTGSGKTLSYVLPIVEILSRNIVRELFCLVIVPSKELAVQVKQVFEQFVIGTNLKVGLFSGTKTFASEQEQVIGKSQKGYHSLVDILVTTSGRLMDHLKQTEGFSLKNLKFLIIDEADKMLTSENDSWVPLVLASIHSGDCQRTHPLTASRFSRPAHFCQKFLFSATLTQSPEKIAPLELYNPVLFTTQAKESIAENDARNVCTVSDGQRFVIPDNLVQKMVVVERSEKPLVLVHVMDEMRYKRVLCFTNSLETTHRLYLLLKAMDKFTVAEFSSRLSEQQRKGILRDFRENKISVLIATDAMSRGMDISEVDLVVNYDSPPSAKRYVHRVGRTARAGTKGETLTVLIQKEFHYFKKMMNKWLQGGHRTIEKFDISNAEFSQYEEQYELALEQLKDTITKEKYSKKR